MRPGHGYPYCDLEPDERDAAIARDAALAERARMAIADLGWNPGVVAFAEEGRVYFHAHGYDVPGAVKYASAHFAGDLDIGVSCWSCSEFAGATWEVRKRCSEGDCSHPDEPRLPPRSLITSGPSRASIYRFALETARFR